LIFLFIIFLYRTVAVIFVLSGFPLALTEISASGSTAANSVNPGAAVKKAAQSVENQAQILTTQLSNKVST